MLRINVKNPNPRNVGLWSDTIGDIINRNQIYGQSTTAITPAAPPPKLGGFGEGSQADVKNNTAYPRTEPLPPLGGFGEGPQPQIPSHTGHPPTVLGISEKLRCFSVLIRRVKDPFKTSSYVPLNKSLTATKGKSQFLFGKAIYYLS